MKLSRRSFLGGAALAAPTISFAPALLAKDKNDPNRFQIGIQEYTFHRWIGSGKLNHLDYPALAKDKLASLISNTGIDLSKESILTKNMLVSWSKEPQVRV